MTFSSGLVNIVKKTAIPAGITALEVPIHETLHSLTAKVLPGVESAGIALNNTRWYAKPLEVITLGYMKATSMDANTGGYALIQQSDTFFGNLDGALTAAVPEVATMTLGMYWINKSTQNIRENGERIGALVKAYCGFKLLAGTYSYMTMSSVNPEKGQDYYNFTESIMKLAYLPPTVAEYVTFAGTALMVTGALYLTNIFSKTDSKTGMLKP